MKENWGRVIGDTAFREWQCNMRSNYSRSLSYGIKCEGLFGYLSSVWPSSLVASKLKSRSKHDGSLPFDDSIMARYLSLENGKFWFAAQNRHGFMLSCYDAELRYNSATDTFQARYSPRGRHTVEDNISWDRLRAPPVDTPPYVLNESDCLDNLEPGHHFEIQWRRNKEYPYVMVMLEFNQYPVDSRWRRAIVSRKSHREEGNEADGFYGGIGKLYDQKESYMEKHLAKEYHGAVSCHLGEFSPGLFKTVNSKAVNC